MNPMRDYKRVEYEIAQTRKTIHAERRGNMLMNHVLSNDNVQIALERVERNKGSHGLDGMSVEELRPYLQEHWQEIRRTLTEGTYQPNRVRRLEIQKTCTAE